MRSPDRRIITPAEIEADDTAGEGLDPAGRQKLSDDVSAKLVAMYNGRQPWRQTYAEQLEGDDSNRLRPRRYPIEDTPQVWLGQVVLETGLYRVDGRCRHELLRDGSIALFSSHRLNPTTLLPGSLSPFEFHDDLHGAKAEYRVPVYVAGYVPPGSVNDAWEPTTAYVAGARGTSYEEPRGAWIASPEAAGSLLFEVTGSGTSGGTIPAFPASMSEWAPGLTYTSLEWLAPPTSLLVFEPTTPGTAGTQEPRWPLEAGDTISAIGGTATWTARTSMEIPDAGVTWTGRNAFEMPLGIRKAALMLARILAIIDREGTCPAEEAEMRTIIGLLGGSC